MLRKDLEEKPDQDGEGQGKIPEKVTFNPRLEGE